MLPNSSKALALASVLSSLLLAGCGGASQPQSPSSARVSSVASSSQSSLATSDVSSSVVSTSAISSSLDASSSLTASSSDSSSSSTATCEGLVGVAQLTRDGLTLEAEDFDACSDHIIELDGPLGDSDYRQSDVDLFTDNTLPSGVYVGRMQATEKLTYSFTPADEGFYQVQLIARGQGASVTLALAGSEATTTINTGAFDANAVRLYVKGGAQALTISVIAGELALDRIVFDYDEPALTATQLVTGMGVGMNLGNTLDVPRGEDWGATPESLGYFQAIKENGFGHVRIPVTWDGYAQDVAPFTIEAVWMERVEQAIDWALAQGLIVIVNAHHERWLKESYTAAKQARIDAIWQQIATRFQHKPSRLIFEILNEPVGMTTEQVNTLNPKILAIMRQSNPNRSVIFSGNGYTPYTALLATNVLVGDNLIGNFHSYDPWPFAGQCIARWGSDADKANMRAIYQAVANWSQTHNIPATVNEFGAAQLDWKKPANICNVEDRKAYLKHHVELQREFGIAGTLWDDDGSFRVYDRRNNSWSDALESLQ